MSVKLLTQHHLEFISLKGGCTGLSESTLVNIPSFVCASSEGSVETAHYAGLYEPSLLVSAINTEI